MRAVDQIVKDLEAVNAEIVILENKRSRYLDELSGVYELAHTSMSNFGLKL
jgi:hypothetical protein